jgi:hypothetical protein
MLLTLPESTAGITTRMKKRTAAKNGAWFYQVRGSYLPCSWQGWLTYIPFTIFLLTVLIAAVRVQHSVSDTVYMIFPQWVAAAVVMSWIAKQKS